MDVTFRVMREFYRGHFKATAGDLGPQGEELAIDLPSCFRRIAAPSIVWDEYVENPLSANRVSWPGRDVEKWDEGTLLVINFYHMDRLQGWRVAFWNFETDVNHPSWEERGLSDGLVMDLWCKNRDRYHELGREVLDGLDKSWTRIKRIVLPAVESVRQLSLRDCETVHRIL